MARTIDSQLLRVIEISKAAGTLALQYRGVANARDKSDGSPVTDADIVCDDLIRHELLRSSALPIVSEESGASHSTAAAAFWLVDPLDGTKEYARGSNEFTVNIALIDNGLPVLGVVSAPALDLVYFAARDVGAFKQHGGKMRQITVGELGDPLRIAVSRDHVGIGESALLARFPNAQVLPMGSSLKFCLVAEGTADLYPRFGPTREWDTAAAQCVVEQAGGHVVDRGGRPLRYGKPGLVNPALITYGSSCPNRC